MPNTLIVSLSNGPMRYGRTPAVMSARVGGGRLSVSSTVTSEAAPIGGGGLPQAARLAASNRMVVVRKIIGVPVRLE